MDERKYDLKYNKIKTVFSLTLISLVSSIESDLIGIQ